MAKEYGIREKDKAADFVVGELLRGNLRSGDKIDRSRIAAHLGMSRVPVQEAIVQLERGSERNRLRTCSACAHRTVACRSWAARRTDAVGA